MQQIEVVSNSMHFTFNLDCRNKVAAVPYISVG